MPPTPAGGAGAARARVPPRRRCCRGAFCGAASASTGFALGRRCDRRRFGGPWSSRGGDGRDTESRRSTSDGVSILTIVARRALFTAGQSQWSLVKVESNAATARFRDCASQAVVRRVGVMTNLDSLSIALGAQVEQSWQIHGKPVLSTMVARGVSEEQRGVATAPAAAELLQGPEGNKDAGTTGGRGTKNKIQVNLEPRKHPIAPPARRRPPPPPR